MADNTAEAGKQQMGLLLWSMHMFFIKTEVSFLKCCALQTTSM